MNADEHQRERMRHWVRWTDETSVYRANARLAEFDKRFPAPSAAAPVEPVANRVGIEWREPETFAQWDDVHKARMVDVAELASLRQKARLWDAVASGKVRLEVNNHGRLFIVWYGPESRGIRTEGFPTAEEAVESAIAQGALK
ncbi:MAG: hypothetical protein KAX77_05520, partial [Xanthomonadales bacterium]|nr:hypothetical protein [Xanthomonadales bacterium]